MITNEQEFTATVDKIAALDLSVAQYEDQRDAAIQTTREQWHGMIDPLKDERKQLLAQARTFAKKNRKTLLGTAKSSESAKGIFGFRLSTPKLSTVGRAAWDKIVQNAKKAKLLQFVRKVEEIDKDRVKAEATPEELEALGCKVTQTESFFVKAKDPGAAASSKSAA